MIFTLLYFKRMKTAILFLFLVFISFSTFSQKKSSVKIYKYYDWQWKEADPKYARFYSILMQTDSGWHRQDYFINARSLQMEGWYDDSTCKIANGEFSYYYANRLLMSKGRYVHGYKEGSWVQYHPNGMLEDSGFYENNRLVGNYLVWYQNGYLADSLEMHVDGSGVEVGWFDNGNLSFAGLFSTNNKKHGKWKYYHKNGNISAEEIFDNGVLVDKHFFDENGKPNADTSNRDHDASFGKKDMDWLNYLSNRIYWPPAYKIENSDKVTIVVAFTIDESGKVCNPYVDTPFDPKFDDIAIEAVRHSPTWSPAVRHNRKIQMIIRQAVTFNQPDN
ncbi:MAG: hypothetical protein C5B52_09740 [Bacteroidetes bacterium]|nr:MAG: hypothetical protein C5B52_09740 [Bacteroidota bacterium]